MAIASCWGADSGVWGKLWKAAGVYIYKKKKKRKRYTYYEISCMSTVIVSMKVLSLLGQV